MTAGRVLADRYELVRRLGAGGMAEVFLARDRRLDRDVAVKVLDVGPASDSTRVRRFEREARIVASLNHPNVVSIHDTGADDGIRFIVMELIDGPTLATVIAERAPLPIHEAVAIAQQVCGALAVAHGAGLVHRDIKPANIMFDASGTVKVTDFGIALVSSATRLTAASDVFGSAAYLSPEQARGGDVDHRADLYGLGCVLYEMLTGDPPFTGDAPVALIHQHLHGEVEPPSTRRADLPAGLDAAVLGMIARDREERPASAEAAADRLSRAAAGGTGEAVTSTRRLEEVTVAVPPADGTAGTTPEEDTASGARGPWRTGLVVVAGVTLLALVLAGTVMRPDGSGEEVPAAAATPTAPADADGAADGTTPPPPSEGPAAPASLRDAALHLYGVVNDGREDGTLSEDAADELAERGDEALEKYRDGKVEEALKKLDEGRRKVEELARDGEITADRAREVLLALDHVERFLDEEASTSGRDRGRDRDEDDD